MTRLTSAHQIALVGIALLALIGASVFGFAVIPALFITLIVVVTAAALMMALRH